MTTSSDGATKAPSLPFAPVYTCLCVCFVLTASLVGARLTSCLSSSAAEGGCTRCLATAATDGRRSRVLDIRCLVSEASGDDSVDGEEEEESAASFRIVLPVYATDTLLCVADSGICQRTTEKTPTTPLPPPPPPPPPPPHLPPPLHLRSLLSSEGHQILSCVGRLKPSDDDDDDGRRSVATTSSLQHSHFQNPLGDSSSSSSFSSSATPQTNPTDDDQLHSSAGERRFNPHEDNLKTNPIVTTTNYTTTNTTKNTTTTTTNTTTTPNTTTNTPSGWADEAIRASAVSALLGQRLEALDLSQNKLRSVACEFLMNLSQLEYVNLSQNLLESFPRHLPQRIQTLDLSENRLEELVIDDGGGRDNWPLDHLVSLNLSGNRLKELTPTSLLSKAFANLEELLASSNVIDRVDRGVFTCRFKRLKYIDLSRNRLTNLTNYTFTNLHNIQTMNFSYNKITNIEFRAFYTSQDSDDCSEDRYYQQLDAVNAELKSGIEISELCSNGRWPSLEVLDLSHNRLSTVPDAIYLGPLCAVRELLLGHNRIVYLPRYLIEQLQELKVIDLQHNAIVWLDVGTFTNQNLRRINLSHNDLRKIISMTFLYLPSVTAIDLSYNAIAYIYKYAFYRICKDESHLIAISLRGNELQSDGAWKVLSLFQHQTTATNLCTVIADLRDNQITHIMGERAREFVKKQIVVDAAQNAAQLDRFHSWNNIQLDLRDNAITCDCELSSEISILSGVVRWLRSNASVLNWNTLRCSKPDFLQGVFVSEFLLSMVCPVELNHASCPSACECTDRVQRPPLQGQRSVQYINCSGRQLHVIDFPTDLVLKQNQTTTTAIDLSYNDLDRMPDLNGDVSSITYVDLSHNHLTQVNDDTLARLPALEELLLHDNRLQLIPHSILTSSVGLLRNVTMGGNPLLCQFSEAGAITRDKLRQLVSDWKIVRCANGRLLEEELNYLTKTEECSEGQQCDGDREEVEGGGGGSDRFLSILLIVLIFALLGIAAGVVRFRANIIAALHRNAWNKIENMEETVIMRHDIFISYSVVDDAWVTGCLLDIICNHFPHYGICLQQQQLSGEGGGGSAAGSFGRRDALEYLKRNIEKNRVTIVVLSRAFIANLWTLDFYRSIIIEQLASGRHQVIFILLDVEVGCDGGELEDLLEEEEEEGQRWLRADDAQFADHLASYLHWTTKANQQSQKDDDVISVIDDAFLGQRNSKEKY